MQDRDFLLLVQKEMQTKKMSLRKLASRAQVSLGKISEILNGKRPLTPYYINKISHALKLSLCDTQRTPGNQKTAHRPDRKLTNDELHFIEEWYHLAILNLIKTKDSTNDPKWIAQRLGIQKQDAEKAIQRLKKLGLIGEVGNKFVRRNSFLSTSIDIPSATIRKMHEQNMKMSIEALNKVPVEYRDVSHITMAISPQNLPQAKKEIQKFRKKIALLLEDGEASEVYLMGIQLIPLSKLQDNY